MLKDEYGKLLAEYRKVGGPEFDQHDIDQAAISYAYNTCAVEGNTISLGETETIIITDKVVPGHTLREHLEIKDAHEAFMKMYGFIEEGFDMSESLAMTFHKLNTRSWIKEESSGQYKTITNRVGGRSTPYPEKARQLFKDLFKKLLEIKDPFERASKLHLETVLIHPWQDGNGRTARLMMNYELLKNGHGHLQISKNDKDIYFKAIRDAIDQKSPQPFHDFLYQLGIQTYQKKIDFLKKKSTGSQGDSVWDYNSVADLY
ncbi:MAG: Fic family protein [Cyclobacteriaceae bacterium]